MFTPGGPFEKLGEICLSYGTRFQPTDLRWEVPEEAALTQRTMEICIAEVRRCLLSGVQPHLIILLGERYGWQPLAAIIEAKEFEAVRERLEKRQDTRTGRPLVSVGPKCRTSRLHFN